MAPAIAQINSSLNGPSLSSQKRKPTIIKPVCVGSVLLAMYVVFMYLIFATFEDETGKDSGAVHHLGNSKTTRGGTRANNMPNKLPGSAVRGGGSEDTTPGIQQSSNTSIKENTQQQQQTSEQKQSYIERIANEHPDLAQFCLDCLWKDTLISCHDRVKFEVEKRHAPEIDAMRRNLMYCTKPHEIHVSEFWGDRQFKDTEFTCDERVKWEVEHYKMSILEAKRRDMQYCKAPPYVLSGLCGGCGRALTNMTSKMYRGGVPCHDIMLRRMKGGQAKHYHEAAKVAAEEQPDTCGMCDPQFCWKNYFGDLNIDVKGLDTEQKGYLTKYWRFDEAAPKFTSPTTLILPSIPKEFRIPPSRFRDIEVYLTEKFRAFESSEDAKHVEIFIEYNPGLTPIPPSMKPNLPKVAAYVVALRVTPANNCFRRDQMGNIEQKVWDHTMMSATNLLGLALLDEEYEMLPGYDIVVDIASQLGFQKDGYGTTYFGEPTFMDYRLFTLNDAIYLHANADVTVVTKLDIRSFKHSRKAQQGEYKLDVIYGENKLEVTMLNMFNTIWSGGDRGKNFALFSVPNATHPDEPDSTYAEIDINPYYQVQQVYLDDIEMLKRSLVKKRIRRNYSVDKIMMRRVKTNPNPIIDDSKIASLVGNLTTSSSPEPDASYYTVDEYWFPGPRPAFRGAGHGGACCVQLTRDEVLAQGEHIHLTEKHWGDNDYLLVGVAHTSVIWRKWYNDKNTKDSDKAMIPHTHYVSFFYAFEPRPPFNLRVRSGYWCLGYAGEDGMEGGVFNPHSVLTRNRPLSQHNETFSCPQISFVSSFIEKVGDPSTTVIGYGINDCTPRIVEVSKAEIARMIFSDPWEMKIERHSSEFERARAEKEEMVMPLKW